MVYKFSEDTINCGEPYWHIEHYDEVFNYLLHYFQHFQEVILYLFQNQKATTC
jgi:hypothetical protein